MDDLYDDLENYNDVNLVNELRTENADLKHKLGECLSSMDTLQKDFDKLAADFKMLETNYSSLLKIARAEIKRKTDTISNLNIEKDMLVLKQFKSAERKNQFKANNKQNLDRGKKKNGRNNVNNLKQNELKRKDSEHPPSEASSTTTDKSNRLTIIENRTVSNLNENNREDMFPDRSGDYHSERYMDRRVSMLASHQFTKFSSDEEFEDMYSALEPKPTSKERSFRNDPERSRKRTRDDAQHAKAHYDNFTAHEKHPSYSDTFQDRYNKNRSGRYYENDRGMNRDQYDSSRSHRNKYSPERHRRGKREFGEDRQAPPLEWTRRLESPPRGRPRREQRPCSDRDQLHHKPDMQRYTHTDTHAVKHSLHGEYEEPLNKRPRVEHYARPEVKTGEDRGQSDKQLLNDQHVTMMEDYVSCQSPDNLHSEHSSSNEPIREIRSIAVTTLEDPRVSSGRYLRCTDGNKDIICTLSSNKIDLRPVNKALWELNKEQPQPQEALACQPPEISSELVNEIYMNIDDPLLNKVLESKDGTDETDYLDERLIEHDTAEKDSSQSTKNEHKDKSVPKHSKNTSSEEEKLVKSVKCKKTKIQKAYKVDITDEPPAKSSSETEKPDTITNRIKHTESSIKLKPPLDKNDESIKIQYASVEEKEKNICISETKASKTVTNVIIQRESEHKEYSIRHTVEGDLELSDETNDETQVELKAKEQVTQKKHRTRKKSQRDSSREKPSDGVNTRKTKSRKEKEEKASTIFSELFGDNSLISPEELALATAQAHARAADDAQERIPLPTHAELPRVDGDIINDTMEASKAEKKKTKSSKDGKTRTHHSKHKKSEHAASVELVKDPKEDQTCLMDTNKEVVDSDPGPFKSIVKSLELIERTDKESSSTCPAKKNKGDEENKDRTLTSKNSKCNEDNTLLPTESAKQTSFINKNATNTGYEKSLSTNEDKENATKNDMPQIFNDTLVPNENKVNEEKPIAKPKETICGSRIEDIPNLVPDKEETGLVKTVVISTGVQPSGPNVRLNIIESLYTPLKALATSTPAKELSTLNTSDQISDADVSCVDGKINENRESLNEKDVPDVRINYYRRRRKVLKKSTSG